MLEKSYLEKALGLSPSKLLYATNNLDKEDLIRSVLNFFEFF